MKAYTIAVVANSQWVMSLSVKRNLAHGKWCIWCYWKQRFWFIRNNQRRRNTIDEQTKISLLQNFINKPKKPHNLLDWKCFMWMPQSVVTTNKLKSLWRKVYFQERRCYKIIMEHYWNIIKIQQAIVCLYNPLILIFHFEWRGYYSLKYKGYITL